METAQLYQLFLQRHSVTTDTRNISPGDIFFALKGPRFNGNTFAQQALSMGASYVVIDEPINFTDDRIIRTTNALSALQQLSHYHRKQFNIPFIAITGSNGKTTTKELVNAVLSSTYKTYTTRGNLNNYIGIPLTLLKIKKDAQLAVIEMGANNPKEIEGYCKYVQPTHGLITNFGKAHLEGFGSIEGVRKAKGELFDYLKNNNGTAFINEDDEFMSQMSKGIKEIITYGTTSGDTRGKISNNNIFLNLKISGSSDDLNTHLVGEYNLANVLASVAIGRYFKVPEAKIKVAIETYIPTNSRSQIIKKDSNTIILDAYNANPSSMKAAIENFAKMDVADKVLLLGGMMELGNESNHEHEQIINMINQCSWYKVVLVGPQFKEIKNPYINLENSTDAKEWFREQDFKNTHILIKGSRSMQMENILE
ncbi:MAG: UDP-N-acetylmuramoyl-tripeptide--D-alanyl-D-alanine ligase [Ginsengibacter sp.]